MCAPTGGCVSQRMFKLGLTLALLAAVVLTLPACGISDSERWDAEVLVEEQPLEELKFAESFTAGKLTLTVTQKTRTRETPVERLTIVHEETYMEFDFDNFGLVFFSILGGVISVGLYFVFAFVVFDTTKDDE